MKETPGCNYSADGERDMALKKKFFFILLVFMASGPLPVFAKVSGLCVNCHTIHNSQNGASVNVGGSRSGLLNTSCSACHQGINSGGTLPYVWSASPPNYGVTGTEVGTNTLAGGSFYWVANGLEETGHNVGSIAPQDTRLLNTPPGGLNMASSLTCAGTYGCHGDRTKTDETRAMFGGHHGDEAVGWKDGSTVANSFRFLLGVQGLEDSNHEYQPTGASNHNKYYGVDRTSEADAAGTISSLCGGCHRDFHNGTGQISTGILGSDAWLRHPTDFDMGRVSSGSEFAGYNGGTGIANPYSVISPVATNDTTATLNTTIYSVTDDAIVMCLSCHRAHGTPYASSLRWDYKAWPGGGYNGCIVCHTVKD